MSDMFQTVWFIIRDLPSFLLGFLQLCVWHMMSGTYFLLLWSILVKVMVCINMYHSQQNKHTVLEADIDVVQCRSRCILYYNIR